MMRLLWSAKARQRRDEIFDYIAADNPAAAHWLDEQFSQAAKRIMVFPLSGRKAGLPALVNLSFTKTIFLCMKSWRTEL